MSRYDRKGALAENFVESFMYEMASDVLIFCAAQPNFKKYRDASEKWDEVVKHLDRSLFDDYDDNVTGAFSEYEKILVEFLWVRGLIDATKGTTQSVSDIAECGDIPGLENAEQELASVCKEFYNKLAPEYKPKCVENLTRLKERIDNNRYCYYLHGLEFSRTLLERVGINQNS